MALSARERAAQLVPQKKGKDRKKQNFKHGGGGMCVQDTFMHVGEYTRSQLVMCRRILH